MKKGIKMKKLKIWAIAFCLLYPTLGLAVPRHATTPSSNLHTINVQIRKQRIQIHKGLKSGQLTKAQAKSQMTQLKNIRLQENQFFHQNGQKEITLDQKNQLQQELNQVGTAN
jgi:hypothetical protein